MIWREFECETSLTLKRQKRVNTFGIFFSPVFLSFAGAYQIFERMTSFFLFFLQYCWSHRLRPPLPRLRRARGEADPPLTGGTRCPQRVGKQMRLRRLTSEGGRVPVASSAPGTNRFERATLRRSVSDEGGEFHLARYQAPCFKLSFEHQCPRVPPDVAEHKFHRTRESDRVSLTLAPLCLRRLRRTPNPRFWIEQQESAFSGALSIKAQ